MHAESEKLRGYFLGSLTDAETEEVDLRVIDDADFSNEVAAAETELIEDFLESRLTGNELQLFNSQYLISPAREDLIREIALLRREATRLRISGAEGKTDQVRTWGWAVRLMVAIGTATALILAALILWPSIWSEQLTPLESEYVSINRQNQDGLSAFDVDSTFNLLPIILRANGGVPTKSAGQTSKEFLFRLALPSSETEAGRYNVRIERGTTHVFTQPGLSNVQNSAGRELRFVVPTAVLPRGQYQIMVENAQTNGELGNYPFAVE